MSEKREDMLPKKFGSGPHKPLWLMEYNGRIISYCKGMLFEGSNFSGYLKLPFEYSSVFVQLINNSIDENVFTSEVKLTLLDQVGTIVEEKKFSRVKLTELNLKVSGDEKAMYFKAERFNS